MNRKGPYSGFFWLPVLLFSVLWYLIKLMFLGMTHISDARECEKMLARNPRRVNYSTRRGVELAYIGQSLFFICAAIVYLVCLSHLQ